MVNGSGGTKRKLKMEPILHGIAAFLFMIWSCWNFSMIEDRSIRRLGFGLILLSLFLLFRLEMQLFDIKIYLKALK